MKRLLICFLLVFALAGSCWAADPTVTLSVAEYVDDGSIVENLNSIAPYREVQFTYSVTSDTGSITYIFSALSNFRTIQNTGSFVGTMLPITEKITFQPEEECRIDVSVNDRVMGVGVTTTHVTARAAQPGEEPKPEPKPDPIADPDPTPDPDPDPQYPVTESRVKFDPPAINFDGIEEWENWAFLSPVLVSGEGAAGLTIFMQMHGLTYDVTIEDPSIVSIDDEMSPMMTVTALKPGTTKITLEVFTQDGNIPTGDRAECVVTVAAPEPEQPGGPVDIPSEPDTPSSPGGGGGGCNSGLPILALAGAGCCIKSRCGTSRLFMRP